MRIREITENAEERWEDKNLKYIPTPDPKRTAKYQKKLLSKKLDTPVKK
jgi:hypothetical protein